VIHFDGQIIAIKRTEKEMAEEVGEQKCSFKSGNFSNNAKII
jgi:hypothetical protein